MVADFGEMGTPKTVPSVVNRVRRKDEDRDCSLLLIF